MEEIEGVTIGSFGKKISVLAIDSVAEHHAGNYTCLARNRAGTASHTSELIVKGTIFFVCLFCFSPASHHSIRFRRQSLA